MVHNSWSAWSTPLQLAISSSLSGLVGMPKQKPGNPRYRRFRAQNSGKVSCVLWAHMYSNSLRINILVHPVISLLTHCSTQPKDCFHGTQTILKATQDFGFCRTILHMLLVPKHFSAEGTQCPVETNRSRLVLFNGQSIVKTTKSLRFAF